MGERIVIRRHPVHRRDRAQRKRIVIGAPVAHHAHGAHRQNGGKGLPDLVIKPVLADLVDINRIGPAQDVQLFARDLAGAADGQTRTGEGVSADKAGGQAQLATQGADLVLEKLAQGLDEFQTHLLRQAADIVVRFDGDRRPARKGHRFDHIRIKRALGQKLGTLDLVGVFLEHIDEQPPNGLALDLGVRNPFQRAKEQVFFVGMDQVQVIIVAEHRNDLFGLTQTQQPVVNEHTGQLVANGLVQQNPGDRAVNAARKRTDHLFVAHLRADFCDHFLAVGGHRPVALKASKPHKIFV